MVPCPAAGITRSYSPICAAAFDIAAKHTSVRRCDNSTLPAATALGHFAFATQSSGMRRINARDTPSFTGTSSLHNTRSTNTAAARATADGALTLPRTAAEVPVRSRYNVPSCTRTCTTTGMARSSTPSPSSASSARASAPSSNVKRARTRRSV